jgi:hypothetical protein
VFIDDGARIAKPVISAISYGIRFVTADTPATEDNVIKLHLCLITSEPAWISRFPLRKRRAAAPRAPCPQVCTHAEYDRINELKLPRCSILLQVMGCPDETPESIRCGPAVV